MVTLKNNFGVEPDKDNPAMNVSEGTGNDAKSPAPGHPKAILNCRRNSHPFQTRTLILNTPAKIGRSVARARPNSYNGIFDCKVLSRNHAIIWYEYDAGKFMIQDTKSSNGTFVNNQRLSKGGETSVPREFFSRDVVQFGVDVLENQRKGNDESDNSGDNNHLVTHGCIVATVKLFHPNGKESKTDQAYTVPDPMKPFPQEKICKLELIIREAQQREGRLHEKLEELQLIVSKLEGAYEDTFTNRFEETRLLSKIANLEKQTKIMSKVISGSEGKLAEKLEAETRQLLNDIEKIQTVAREIQERQHRKLLESEQKMIETQRVATSLENEVITLQEQVSITETHLQEMEAKCNAYCQTIDILKSNYHAQIELTQKLEARVTKFEEREAENDFETNFRELKTNADKYKFVPGELDEATQKEKENQEIILEKCKYYEEEDREDDADFISENEKTEWLTKKFDGIVDALCNGLEHASNCIGQLEGALMDTERSKKKVEKLYIRSQAINLELHTAKMPAEELEKTENDFEREIIKSVISPSVGNEKITELEIELEENKELLNQAKLKQRESEGKYSKLRCELDAKIKHCEKLIVELWNLKSQLKSRLKHHEDNANTYKQKISKLESELSEIKTGHKSIPSEVVEDEWQNKESKETQTQFHLINSSTNTDDVKEAESDDQSSLMELSKEPISDEREKSCEEEKSETHYKNKIDNSDNENAEIIRNLKSKEDGTFGIYQMGAWEKIQKIQSVLSYQLAGEAAISSIQVNEMRNLINLLAEDLVHLLLREQQILRDNQCLQRKLNTTLPQDVIPGIGLAMHLRNFVLLSCIAIIAYIIFVVIL